MNNPQPTFRIGRVAFTIAAASALMVVAAWFYHPLMIWLNGEQWCVQFHADGQQQVLYGADCQKGDR